MNKYEKLIEIKLNIKTINNIDSSLRELQLRSIFITFLEEVKNLENGLDVEAMIDTANRIMLSSRVQELRESILERLQIRLSYLNLQEADIQFNNFIQDIVLLKILYDERIFYTDFLDKCREFRDRYIQLNSESPNNTEFQLKLFSEMYSEFKHLIEIYGVTITQTELAASEVGDNDYSQIDFDAHLLMLVSDWSDYRKIIILLQLFTLVSSIVIIKRK